MFHPNGPTFYELAVQALSSTERGYDLLAPKFDYTPFRTPDALLQAVGAQLGPAGSVGSALDVCCGTGAGLRMLRPLCRDRLVGVDISRGMLEVCRRNLADTAGPAQLELVRGNALALPFGAEFDLAVCFGACGHILPRDEERFAAEIARVLKPGGRFGFVCSFMPPAWSRSYWLARLFNAAMHVRNWIISPSFIMYYLTFVLPQAQKLLERQGLRVEVRDLGFTGPWSAFRLVIATRPSP